MTTVQARLDEASARDLAHLTQSLGLSSSEVVREALRMMAALHPAKGKRTFVGLGAFDSGISDLATNKKHLEGFGS